MSIAIISDEGPEEGGNNEVIKHLVKSLSEYDVRVEYIRVENFYPKSIPIRWKELLRFAYLVRLARADYGRYDLIITLQPNSHYIRHRRHFVYFQHHMRQYYNLFENTFKEKKGLKKKLIFLFLSLLARFADQIFLVPNLKRSFVIANSETVADRLVRYNRLPRPVVLNPGCDIIGFQERDQRLLTVIEGQSLTKRNYVLFFSRLSIMEKGIDVVIKTARITGEITFIIAGPSGPDAQSPQLKNLPSNVHLIVAKFSSAQKSELYWNCSVFLAPYVDEDFGISPLEANGCGKPVVYCNDSGEVTRTQRHLITGFKCPRDPIKISEAIRYCVKNSHFMREDCIKNAKNYPWETFELSIRKLVKQIGIEKKGYGSVY